MENNKAENERKELNRKLMKRTFQSELKEQRKKRRKKFWIDFAMVFIGMFLADWVIQKLGIEYWFLKMASTLAFIMLFLVLGSFIMKEKNR